MADLPDPVAGLRFRPAGREDADAVHALSQACADVDRQQERESLEDVDEQLRTEWWDPETDGAVGVGADGQVLAYGAVLRRPGQLRTRQALLRGLVHPRRCAAAASAGPCSPGSAPAARSCSRRATADPTCRACCAASSRTTSPTAPRWCARPGSSPAASPPSWAATARWPCPTSPLPDGVELRRLSAATSGADLQERVRQAHNEAFADHWGSEPIEAADWRRYCVDGPGCRPDLSFAAVDAAGRVVGLPGERHLRPGLGAAGVHRGLDRPARGRRRAPRPGPGPRAARPRPCRPTSRRGWSAPGLGVDVDNPQALGLYLDLGYVERGRETSWVRDVRPPDLARPEVPGGPVEAAQPPR